MSTTPSPVTSDDAHDGTSTDEYEELPPSDPEAEADDHEPGFDQADDAELDPYEDPDIAEDVHLDPDLDGEVDGEVDLDAYLEVDGDLDIEADLDDEDVEFELDEDEGSPMAGPPLSTRMSRMLAARYGALPVWLVMAQCFLTVGWLRATIAHAVSPGWRNGAEVDAFQLAHQALVIDWYREVVFDGLLQVGSGRIASAVLIAQILVALSLGLNQWVPVGLGIGAFLNINFVLAGAVDPSTFYLVITATIALWHIERSANPVRSWWLTLISTIVGFTMVGALVPQIGTFDPALVVDDPAIVLTFITLLWMGALWLSFVRQILTLRPSHLDRTPLAEAQDGEELVASDTLATIRLITGTDPQEAWEQDELEAELSVTS